MAMLTQYINKAIIEAEIKRRISAYQKNFDDKAYDKTTKSNIVGRILGLKSFLSFLNTIEVKEVDLEKEIEKYLIANAKLLIEGNSKLVVHHIAEHFFELGLKYKKGK